MSRVALITGAARGIGLATAQAFASGGWQVVGVDRLPVERTASGVSHWQADLSDPEAISSIFERLERELGRLDALINNAAVQVAKPAAETTLEDWDRVHDVNLRATFLACRAARGLLRASKGAIVNVSSVHALATSVGIAAYAASKGGVLALTRALALEYGVDQVRVNAVLPGAVDTEMLRDGLSRGHAAGADLDAQVRTLGRRTALGRVGRPEEIAQAILFLADPERASYIAGQALVVDGGALARLSTE